MNSDNKPSLSVRLLSSNSLAGATFMITAASVALLFFNDRSVTLQIIFTLVSGLQFMFMIWMLATAISVLYDAFMSHGSLLNIITILDFYVFYIIVWTNTGVLFWLWDTSPNRDSSFTGISALNPFYAWVAFLYLIVFIINGIGFGRYIPNTLLSESWGTALAIMNPILMSIIISTIATIARENVVSESDSNNNKNRKYS